LFFVFCFLFCDFCASSVNSRCSTH
jgi:hypothetical protein